MLKIKHIPISAALAAMEKEKAPQVLNIDDLFATKNKLLQLYVQPTTGVANPKGHELTLIFDTCSATPAGVDDGGRLSPDTLKIALQPLPTTSGDELFDNPPDNFPFRHQAPETTVLSLQHDILVPSFHDFKADAIEHPIFMPHSALRTPVVIADDDGTALLFEKNYTYQFDITFTVDTTGADDSSTLTIKITDGETEVHETVSAEVTGDIHTFSTSLMIDAAPCRGFRIIPEEYTSSPHTGAFGIVKAKLSSAVVTNVSRQPTTQVFGPFAVYNKDTKRFSQFLVLVTV